MLIVIPVRNEEARLAPGLTLLAQRLQACGFGDYGVVVSDNGSSDGTAALARACGDPRVSYLRACEQGDKGAAIAAGWATESSSVTVLAYVDVDMATDPEALVRGFRLIAEGLADVVLPDGERAGQTVQATLLPFTLGGVLLASVVIVERHHLLIRKSDATVHKPTALTP